MHRLEGGLLEFKSPQPAVPLGHYPMRGNAAHIKENNALKNFQPFQDLLFALESRCETIFYMWFQQLLLILKPSEKDLDLKMARWYEIDSSKRTSLAQLKLLIGCHLPSNPILLFWFNYLCSISFTVEVVSMFGIT